MPDTIGRFSFPALYVSGRVTNRSSDVHAFSIRVVAWDGKFVVAVSKPIEVLNLRPGESQEWRGYGLADRTHPLPAKPRCTSTVAVDP